MKLCKAVIILSIALVVSASKDLNLQKKNELKNTPQQKADIIMSKLDDHCRVISHPKIESRKKRSSVDNFRTTVLRSLRDCAGPNDVNPTDDMPSTADDGLPPSSDGPCTSPHTVNLTGSWRKDNRGSKMRPYAGEYACDRNLQRDTIWFRFTGAAGSQLADRCAPDYSCGGHGGFWSDSPMPTRIGEVKMVPIKGSWNGNCNWYTWPLTNALTVQRCSARPGDFVYKVNGTASCSWTFCGMDIIG